MSEKPIRVIHVLPHAAAGGATLATMDLVERLDPRRYDVSLAVGPDSAGEGSVLEEMRARGLRVESIPHMHREPHLRDDARALAELGTLFHRARPQIVHAHGSKAKLLTPLAAVFGQVPIRVAHIWGWEWMPVTGPVKRCACRWSARLTAPVYDALIACSEAMRDQGLAHAVGIPGQYQVTLPSIDLTAFNQEDRDAVRAEVRSELGLPEEATVVICVTRLARQKAPEVLLQAAELLSRRLPDLRWLIVGGGPLAARVRHAIADLNLQGRVMLTGPRRDIARLLKAADIFALPSRWEPFGIVYLEAAAVGLPVVGTRVDGAPEAVAQGDTGLLVEADNPAEFAAAVERIATEGTLARRLGEAGRMRALQFGHDRFVRAIEEIYERLLAEKGEAPRWPQVRSPSHAAS